MRCTGAEIVKKMAQYHQYFAANKAVDQTLRAVGAAERRDATRTETSAERAISGRA